MTKPTKWHVHPLKTQNSLGIRPVWSESLLCALRKLVSLATHWTDSKDSDQTGCMPRLIWVFAGCTVILLALSWGGSIYFARKEPSESSKRRGIPQILGEIIFGIHPVRLALQAKRRQPYRLYIKVSTSQTGSTSFFIETHFNYNLKYYHLAPK